MNPHPTRIAIVDDRPELRESLSRLLNSREETECVAAYTNGEEALKKLPMVKCDVVLMDLHLNETRHSMDGIECVTKLKERTNPPKVIMFTIEDYPEKIFQALKAGADGYLIKDDAPDRIFQAIKEILNGGAPMSSQVARLVVHAFHDKPKSEGKNETLSKRQTEILDLLTRGYRTKEIAKYLNLSSETINTHIRNIFEKLRVRSRAEAVAKYIQGKSKRH
jgi:DNA-binding NarL/FixJ family response regulator